MSEYNLNNRFITINGERKILSEWCRQYGISMQCVNERVKCGWDIETAITKPPRRYRYNILREGK